MNNNLKILDDFKKNEGLTYATLNNSLIYGSIISVNLIDVLKDYYNVEIPISVDFTDLVIKSFLESSLNNFFLNNYKDNYGIERNSKGYISWLTRYIGYDENNVKKSCEVKTSDNSYNLPVFKLYDNIDGNMKMEYDENNYNLKVSHHFKLNSSDVNHYSESIGSRGYGTTLTLNSYAVDKYGHVISNIKRTIRFPTMNKTFYIKRVDINFENRGSSNKIIIDTLDTALAKYLTMFAFTFYSRRGSRYYTVCLSCQELKERATVIMEIEDENTHYDHFKVYIQRIGAMIYLWHDYNSLVTDENGRNIDLKVVKAMTIN